MAKKGGITLADVNPRCLERNMASIIAQTRPKARISANPTPVSPKKGIRVAKKPSTRPEREMAMILRRQHEAGEIHSFEFEGITLSVGDGTRYTPDFAVRLHSGKLRFVEVKGPFIREDGLLKWKVAKGKYPFDEWELWQLLKTGWTRIA